MKQRLTSIVIIIQISGRKSSQPQGQMNIHGGVHLVQPWPVHHQLGFTTTEEIYNKPNSYEFRSNNGLLILTCRGKMTIVLTFLQVASDITNLHKHVNHMNTEKYKNFGSCVLATLGMASSASLVSSLTYHKKYVNVTCWNQSPLFNSVPLHLNLQIHGQYDDHTLQMPVV